MKKFLLPISFAAASALAACTTNPDTGETEILGLVPVETAVGAAEAAAEEASRSGGALGVAGALVASAIALWRRRKELAEKSNAERAKTVASSVIDGVDAVLKKAAAAEAEGGSWAPTKEELIALLKAAQNAAGTRADVDALIREKSAS